MTYLWYCSLNNLIFIPEEMDLLKSLALWDRLDKGNNNMKALKLLEKVTAYPIYLVRRSFFFPSPIPKC